MDPVVILGTERVSVGPGQEQHLAVRVRNPGRRVESYRIEVVGAPSAFSRIDPAAVSVLPGREAEIAVTFQPPGGSSTPTGVIPFAIRATSEVEASSSAAAEGQLELAGVAGLQAWAPETSRAGRWSARYHVEFANQGNAAVRLALTAHDPAGTTRLRLTPDVVDLPPAGRATATLKATARQPFLRGTPANRTLQVSCQTFPFGAQRPEPGGAPPQGDPNHRTFQLTLQQKPILPKLAVPLLVLAATAAIAFAVVKLRSGEKLELETAKPPVPLDFTGGATSQSSIQLGWAAVPNAVKYKISQVSVNDQPSVKVIDDALSAEQTTLEVPELAASTKYCYEVRAIGVDESESPPKPICVTTSPPTTLPKPENVLVVAAGGDRYNVSWEPAAVSGVNFVILLDGSVTTTQGPSSPIGLVIPREGEAHNVAVSVMAVRGEEKVESDKQQVPIPAADVVTLPAVVPTIAGGDTSAPAAATTVPTATTAGGDTATTTGAGTGSTVPSTGSTVSNGSTGSTGSTGGAGSSTSATSSAEVSPNATTELQSLSGIWVADFGQVNPTSGGGRGLEERKESVVKTFGVPADAIKTFTNRDTVAQLEGQRRTELDRATASTRFIYVQAPSAAAARDICAGNTTLCAVHLLTGAAKLAENKPILIVDRLPSTASTADVDARLELKRTELKRRDVFALDGSRYTKLGTGEIIVFVPFAAASEATTVCAANKIAPCDVRTLQPNS